METRTRAHINKIIKKPYTIKHKIKKMKKLLFSIVFFSAFSTNAQVGIGTPTPSANAVLDLTSTSKGLLLPRVDDTTNVPNPTAGLMVYNKNTNTAAVHNGVQWSSLVTNLTQSAAASGDSLTYTINPGPGGGGFTAGTFPLSSIQLGLGNPGTAPATWSEITISKKNDINSISFLKSANTVATIGIFEIKFFSSGATTPYYSVKMVSWKCTGYSMAQGTGYNMFSESLSFKAEVFGFKDWVNNKSYAWSFVTNTETTY
jgi:hypothetical protein